MSLVRFVKSISVNSLKLIANPPVLIRNLLERHLHEFKMQKSLAVFDFDHTILDDNSDTAVVSLVDKSSIPQDIKDLHQVDGWTAFMQGIFTLLHEKGVSADTIQNTVANLPAVMGMPALIRDLKAKDFDVIIISDSNSIFINIWLQKQDLEKCITRVFTNPSEVIAGMFKISMYHLQNSCKLSTKNLCKGKVLQDFIAEQKQRDISYERIIYVGDGVNDFCPILHLREGDLACVRNNFKLLDLVTKAKKGKSFDPTGKPHVLYPEILIWETGNDILRRLNE